MPTPLLMTPLPEALVSIAYVTTGIGGYACGSCPRRRTIRAPWLNKGDKQGAESTDGSAGTVDNGFALSHVSKLDPFSESFLESTPHFEDLWVSKPRALTRALGRTPYPNELKFVTFQPRCHCCNLTRRQLLLHTTSNYSLLNLNNCCTPVQNVLAFHGARKSVFLKSSGDHERFCSKHLVYSTDEIAQTVMIGWKFSLEIAKKKRMVERDLERMKVVNFDPYQFGTGKIGKDYKVDLTGVVCERFKDEELLTPYWACYNQLDRARFAKFVCEDRDYVGLHPNIVT
ncbi:hypothetical protein HDU76_005669, partial [Blyttiomyces sp. JEL0837]